MEDVITGFKQDNENFAAIFSERWLWLIALTSVMQTFSPNFGVFLFFIITFQLRLREKETKGPL